MTSELDLKGKDITDDPAIEKVIEAQGKLSAAMRKIGTLETDRKQLLEEYSDMVGKRPVPVSPNRCSIAEKAVSVRVSVGDLHGMRMDKGAVRAFLADLKMLNPDVVVLGGDMLECGGWLAKHQPIGFIALLDYTYQEDIGAANWFLNEVQKAAPKAEVHYMEGQHEDRIERWIVDQVTANARDAEFLYSLVSPYTLLRLKERNISYYRRSMVYGEGLPRGWVKLGNMHFTHELGTSQNAAASAVSKTAGNVTYFHTHREDSATRIFPAIGACRAFNPGCMCTMQPVWRNSDPTNWSQGYGIDFITKSSQFMHTNIPIWKGKTMLSSMVELFKT